MLINDVIRAIPVDVLVIAGTGHRPEKLGGYTEAVYRRLFDLAKAALERERPAIVISGMALGWDWALAKAAAHLEIPFIAAVPFAGQESRWRPDVQDAYRALLAKAAAIHIVSPGGYSAYAMQVRNEWMVNRCARMLALWDGTSGGTGNCIKFADEIGRPYRNLWDSWKKYR